MARAQRLARPIAQLTAALFRETNPVPVKYALALLGLMSPAVRLPLVELSNQSRAELGEVLLRLCDEYADCMIGRVGNLARHGPRPGGHVANPAAAGRISRTGPRGARPRV